MLLFFNVNTYIISTERNNTGVTEMNSDKKVLLIGGGGTLGTYTAEELLRLGCQVDILCPEEKTPENSRLRFIRGYATLRFLNDVLKSNKYDGIVNFVLYRSLEEYKPVHKILSENTEHLIFVSSYRVYADCAHPITEQAPLLADVVYDEHFLSTEDYALPKTKCEKFLRDGSNTYNWTVVRPVISFSEKRLDLVTVTGHEIIEKAEAGKELLLPQAAKNLTAGLDWAGNSGKLIANLMFKPKCFEKAYTVSSAPNLKWGEVAEIYKKLTGIKIRWVSTEEYVETGHGGYGLFYDRLFNREIDNTKILEATGLKKDDFVSIENGIKIELAKLGFHKNEGAKPKK